MKHGRTEDAVYDLPAYLDTTHPKVNTWRVWCEFCLEWHTHGAGGKNDDPRRYLGHRTAHCLRDAAPLAWDSYNLVYGGLWEDLSPAQRRHGLSGRPPTLRNRRVRESSR